MRYVVDTTTEVAGLSRHRWDSAGGDSLYLRYDWLASVHGRVAPEQHYLTLVDGASGAPAGKLGCFLLTGPAVNYATYDPVLLANQGGPTGAAAGEDPAGGPYPILVCAVPNGYLAALAARPAEGPARREVLAALLDEFDTLAGRLGAVARAVLYVPEEDEVCCGVLADAGYLGSLVGADCVLRRDFTDLGEYLRGLRGVRATREVARFEASGIDVEVTGPEVLDERCALVQLRQYERYGLTNGSVDHVLRSFDHARRHLADRMRVLTGRRDGDLLGFVVCYEDGAEWYVRYGAVDHERVRRGEFAHFNIQYYQLVRHALAEKIDTIHYGLGSYATKVLRGCRMRRLRAYLKVDGTSVTDLPSRWTTMGDLVAEELREAALGAG